MKPAPFKYVAARSVDEAVAALAAADGDAKLLAGGQSLVPMLNFRLLEPAVLVDINRIEGLDRIEAVDGGVRVGALARHVQVEQDALIAARFPVVTAAMRYVAHIGIRNRGTFAGSLSHADPAAELPMLARLLDATLTIVGPKGEREVGAANFFVDALTSDLGEDEMVTSVFLPDLPAGCTWGFEEFARRHGDFAIAAVATVLDMDGDSCKAARIAMAGVGHTPLRAPSGEAALAGQGRDAIDGAAAAAASDADPVNDLQGSAAYRRHLVSVLTGRVLRQAWGSA
ncbi:MAG: FAD binding domain-containing protein [Alphaproteobacteria bacterium]